MLLTRACASTGLSPLARGNLMLIGLRARFAGPIPARTGQPCTFSTMLAVQWAYPRSHGATRQRQRAANSDWGLSPLARGNRMVTVLPPTLIGPIPARTGQPTKAHFAKCACGAYPRSHGATLASGTPRLRKKGLSPLARGNHHPPHPAGARAGPIPARTGQPSRVVFKQCCLRAYPRSHGATALAHSADIFLKGLSPLARGNPSP